MATGFGETVQKAEKDVPEVEDVKRLILPILRKHWDKHVALAMLDVLSMLGAIEDRLPTPGVDALVHAGGDDKDREILILALLEGFWLAIERRMWTPLETRRLEVIREGISDLLREGGSAAGFAYPLNKPRGAIIPGLSEGMLHLQLFGHLVSNRQLIERVLRDMLTDRRMRMEAKSKAQDSEVVRRLNALLLAEPQADVLVGEPWMPAVVDAWAYGTYNLGGIVALIDGRVGSIVAFNNPPHGPDIHTTAFCRWVHLKIISVADVDAKIAEIRAAVVADDFEALKKARPLTIKDNTPSGWARQLRVAVFPPYHWRCRTVARSGPPVG